MSESTTGEHEETYRGSHIRVMTVPERKLDSGAKVLAHLALRVNGQAVATRAPTVEAAVRRGRHVVDRSLLDARLLPVLRPLAAVGPGTTKLVAVDRVSKGDTVWVYGWGLWRRGQVTRIARINVTVSYVSASRDKVHHKSVPFRDLRRAASATPARPAPGREEAADWCRRCGARIGLYRGLWWGGDFMCPDAESQHAPRGLWQQRPAGRTREQIAAVQGWFMRSANGGTPQRVPARTALGEIEAARDDGVLVEDLSGDAAVIPFRDRRGRIELRPATTAENAEQAVADHEVYGPGSEVTVRPVTWDRRARGHVVGAEFAATVVHGVNGGRYKVRAHGGREGVFTLDELRPAGATRRPVEALRAGSHAVWNTGARSGDSTSRRWPTSPYVYACRDCRTRGTRGDLETRPCTPQVETALSLERAEGLLPEAFARWESRVVTARGTETGVFSRGVAVEMTAAELRAGASYAWEDDGLTLRRDGFTTVVEPYRSPEERAAEAEERAAEDLRWEKILADTEDVAFEELKVGDVLVRGYGDGRRAQVVRPAEDFTDRFGRTMRRLWCRAEDDSGREGWVEFGPGGRTLRQMTGLRDTSPSLPQNGQLARCAYCGEPITWSYQESAPGSDNAPGTWTDGGGAVQCPARHGLTDPAHSPAAEGALGLGELRARFRRTMDHLAHTDAEDRLVSLLVHAAVLFPVLDGRADLAEMPEQFRAVMHAAASVTHPPALAALARRACHLWEGVAESAEGTRDAFVGCLPEHAGHPAVRAALAQARGAGVPLAVIGRDWRWGYGEHGAHGLFVVPTGERTVECEWFIDGRSNETAMRPAQVRRLRPARNAALTEVRRSLTDAGWGGLTTASRRTHTLRLLSVLVTMPDTNAPEG
ncbi:hypothetical protein [[Kitasatospora] papulosa]|uniref:hypothetical protein n=1 Tax=[Kitasatospora] papulosa TaxID=1464011 RepID=UPI003675D148